MPVILDFFCSRGIPASGFLLGYLKKLGVRKNTMSRFSLGNRLRNLRKERQFTQRALAIKAGISVNAVSLIERDEISPSVATLQSLARAMEVKMSYFFDDSVETNAIFLKAQQRPKVISDGITIESIGQRLQGQQLEPFLIVLESRAESGKQFVVHAGHEFVYCLQGVIEYRVADMAYHLEVGDMLIFEASQPHHWRNPGAQEAKMLLMLQSDDEISGPVRGHFPAHPSLKHIE